MKEKQIGHLDIWPTDILTARKIQLELAARVSCSDELGPVRYVAGTDVGFESHGKITRAAVVVLDYPQLNVCDRVVSRSTTRFPYVPGYLSFRELPAILEAINQLTIQPDLILCDGQGLAHPRRLGLACHLGVLLDVPSVGVAKSRLIGVHAEVPSDKGQWTPLLDKNETIGAVVRTRTNVNPLYISIGHKINLTSAIQYVLHCTKRYRLPETTRWAHRLASG